MDRSNLKKDKRKDFEVFSDDLDDPCNGYLAIFGQQEGVEKRDFEVKYPHSRYKRQQDREQPYFLFRNGRVMNILEWAIVCSQWEKVQVLYNHDLCEVRASPSDEKVLATLGLLLSSHQGLETVYYDKNNKIISRAKYLKIKYDFNEIELQEFLLNDEEESLSFFDKVLKNAELKGLKSIDLAALLIQSIDPNASKPLFCLRILESSYFKLEYLLNLDNIDLLNLFYKLVRLENTEITENIYHQFFIQYNNYIDPLSISINVNFQAALSDAITSNNYLFIEAFFEKMQDPIIFMAMTGSVIYGKSVLHLAFKDYNSGEVNLDMLTLIVNKAESVGISISNLRDVSGLTPIDYVFKPSKKYLISNWSTVMKSYGNSVYTLFKIIGGGIYHDITHMNPKEDPVDNNNNYS